MGAKSNSDVSGISIGLGFVALGAMLAYWLEDVYGAGTKYVAASLILLGVVGVMLELQKRVTAKRLRFDSGGVGVFLSVLGIYFTWLIYQHTTSFWRALAVSLLSLVILFGFVGVIDFVVSIFEDMVKSKKDMKSQLTGFIKFISFVATSAVAVVAALKQVI